MDGSTTRQLNADNNSKKSSRSRSQLKPGYLLQNRYRIMGTLGVGGFSSVYQARDMRFAAVTRLCAIKEMLTVSKSKASQELAQKTFETEASILATLEHPAIPEVFDYFTEGDSYYLVMEFIRGKDLEAVSASRKKPCSQEEVMDWALQICEVMVYLHNQKPEPIVFRDLKPSNLMLDQHNRIRLIDFGIAKIFQEGARGTMIGTEGYSPPEQYKGESSPAGDVYALGATLHHLLTHRDPRMEPPFSWHERPIKELNDQVSDGLITIVNRCISYKATNRYQDAGELKQALSQLNVLPTGKTGFLWPGRDAGSPPPTEANAADLNLGFAPPSVAGAPEQFQNPGQTHPQQVVQQQPAGPQSMGMSYSNEFPEIKPIWKFKCEDEIRSKPAISEQMVYVGAYDNNLYAVDLRDGSFKWKYPATDGIGSAPAVHEDDVLIGSSDQHLYCINRHTGRLRWRYQTNGAVYSSPAARYNYVFFGSDDAHLHAVSTTTGRPVWKVDAHGAIRSSPLITDDAIVFGTNEGYVFSLDPKSKVKWQFQARRAVVSSPAAAEGMIFVGSMDNTVYALDENSGWAVWRARTNRPVISSPIVHNETLFIGSADGKLYALDIYTGRQIWSWETEGQVASSPAIYEDAVYFGSTDGYVYSLTTKQGKLRWKFKTGSHVISSPVIENRTVFIGSSDHYLYALPV
ncbi:MAG: outer membrane protein assembly factor BamB [Cellvibrionaceae bacterium]|jgi:outer membrane protein assembly factor BamB